MNLSYFCQGQSLKKIVLEKDSGVFLSHKEIILVNMIIAERDYLQQKDINNQKLNLINDSIQLVQGNQIKNLQLQVNLKDSIITIKNADIKYLQDENKSLKGKLALSNLLNYLLLTTLLITTTIITIKTI